MWLMKNLRVFSCILYQEAIYLDIDLRLFLTFISVLENKYQIGKD